MLVGLMALAIAGCSLFADLGGLSSGDADPAGQATGADATTGDGSLAFDAAAIPDGGAAYVAEILADSPIAYYPLEETSGTTARDVIGGRDGTWTGTVSLGVPAVIGGGARLDGTTRLEMPAGAFRFEGKAPCTVELWLNASVVDASLRFLFSHGLVSGSAGGYKIYFDQTFFLMSRSDDDGGADGYAKVPSPIPTGQPLHLVMTYDGARARLYMNALSDGPENSAISISALPDARLVFGDAAKGLAHKFSGTLDEIAIYDKALSAERIRAHYDAAR